MPTLKDIAKATGVSIATVSYVLNNGPRAVSPATREKVLEALRELNYRPNAAARGLKGKRTDTIGVIFPHAVAAPIDNSYFSPIIAGILDVATEQKFACLLFSGLDWETVEANTSLYGDGRCDGAIVIAVPKDSELIQSMHNFGLPFVLVGTHPTNLITNSIDTDNVEGARQVTGHLLDLGHRRIGMLQGNENSSSNDERTKGFCLAHTERGLAVDPNLLFPSAYQDDVAYESAMRALRLPKGQRPKALFCANDMLAAMAYRAAAELGLGIPAELSIVGFDDYAFAKSMIPPLTTIRQPLRAIGARAAEVLLDRVHGKDAPPAPYLFEPQLMVRGSTAPPTQD